MTVSKNGTELIIAYELDYYYYGTEEEPGYTPRRLVGVFTTKELCKQGLIDYLSKKYGVKNGEEYLYNNASEFEFIRTTLNEVQGYPKELTFKEITK